MSRLSSKQAPDLVCVQTPRKLLRWRSRLGAAVTLALPRSLATATPCKWLSSLSWSIRSLSERSANARNHCATALSARKSVGIGGADSPVPRGAAWPCARERRTLPSAVRPKTSPNAAHTGALRPVALQGPCGTWTERHLLMCFISACADSDAAAEAKVARL